MNFRILILATALALPGMYAKSQGLPAPGLPFAGQNYTISLNPSSGAASGAFPEYFTDVIAARGLPVDTLLTGNTSPLPAGKQHGEFAFLRSWDAETGLSTDLGLDLGPASTCTVQLDNQAPGAGGLQLVLNDPVVTEWSIMGENGLFVTESVRLGYSGWQLVNTVLPPHSAQ